MAKKKTGLGIEALFPQEEEPAEEARDQKSRSSPKPKTSPRKSQAKSKTEGASKRAAPREERIKTSVDLLPETIELIDQIKSQHRRQHHRLLPMWKILDDAVREFAERQLK